MFSLSLDAEFVVYLLDKTIARYAVKGREIGNEKLIGVLDFQNITYRNVDARGLITGFQFLQVMYVLRNMLKRTLFHVSYIRETERG
ncbi:hypothetical protein Golax_025587 [Gossypium laxum]|uniref:CRAL-TRIO domain-containing protein n=1 Tax=Gossypium laxum TaxID=34288 RepID=A0A7J9B3G5_9ROSI|nr:hypothetical protein [Gossypium laxum]